MLFLFSFQEVNAYRKILNSSEQDYGKIHEFKQKFESGCAEHSTLSPVEIEHLSQTIVTQMPFAFLKSHSTSYAMVGYWGAYYKTHFRDIFEEAFK